MFPLLKNSSKGLELILHEARTTCTNLRQIRLTGNSSAHSATQQPAVNALKFGSRTALIDSNGVYSYRDLAQLSVVLSDRLKSLAPSLQGERIAFITPSDASYVVSKWSTWMSGGICVPICKTHPPAEIEYVLQDSKPKIVISASKYSEMIDSLASKLGIAHFALDDNFMHESTAGVGVESLGNNLAPDDGALIIYTSGTTGRPKGVLWDHGNLSSQVDRMLNCWHWQNNDTILHVLPLHHVHGVVNALMCPLAIGATVIMKDKFSPKEAWQHLLGEIPNLSKTTVFMAVPTIYIKMLQYYDANLADRAEDVREKCKDIRLMISGSASLPEPIFKRWKEVTAHDLLERYGMTEIGMALTNPYNRPRLSSTVGLPFPGVEVKIISEESPQKLITYATSESVSQDEELQSQQGDLLVRGSIFKEYWGKPEATKASFTADGWFKTGDTAIYKDGAFRIVGRTSVDIIKSGGYKISALDIERHLLGHENIAEVAVLGVPDETWGQVIAALIVLKNPEESMTMESLKKWCLDRMPYYHVPRKLKTVTEIPKNAMQKVNKKQLVVIFKD